MSTKPIAFLIGAGSHIGVSLAQKLKHEGYSVAFGSRKPDVEKLKDSGYLPVSVDATVQDSIANAFATVRKELGAPSVVVYNVSVFYPIPEPADPLSLARSDFFHSLNVGAGVFTAAQEMLRGLREAQTLETTARKAFIVTGNYLPFLSASASASPGLRHFFTGTIQKSLEVDLVKHFHFAYKEEGIRFHYAHLVSSEGGIPNLKSGEEGFFTSAPTHAKVYWDLISREEPEDWDYRFTLDGKKLPTA